MKRNTIIIGAVIVAVVVVAVILGVRQMTAGASATSVRAQTATVQRGTIVATVNAAGNVSAPEEAALAFQTSGRVTQVNVQVGDQVKKGQLLMELDASDLALSLKSAQVNLASAQANYDSAKSKNAQNANQLIVAKAQLDKATIALQKAQGDYNAIAWRGDIGMTAQAQALQSATIDYQSALANYNITAAGINDTALRTAQASLDSAQLGVEQAQRNLDKARLYAPFAGIVAQVNSSVGDTAGSATAVVMADLAQLQVKVTIAEVDIEKIKVGESAEMTLDALPGKTYTARVAAIGPIATITQGVVNYPVTAAITDADGAIRPGMTANLQIAVEQRENVLLVPLRAVRAQGNQRSVTVSYKGQAFSVPVVTGLSNEQYVEISSGLKEGDEVVINQTQTRQPNIGAFGPAAGPVFIGGGR